MKEHLEVGARTAANKAELIIKLHMLGHNASTIAGMLRMKKKDVKLIIEIHENPRLRLNLEKIRNDEEEARTARSARGPADLDSARRFRTRYGFTIEPVDAEIELTREETMILEDELRSLSFDESRAEFDNRGEDKQDQLTLGVAGPHDNLTFDDSDSDGGGIILEVSATHCDDADYIDSDDSMIDPVTFEIVEDVPAPKAASSTKDQFDTIFPRKKIPSYRWDLRIKRCIERLVLKILDRILGIDNVA
ncbi:hypothetical protein J8273_7085 [Carpediemonas membranifera]|uniref:Uncharacterized protein n=1 Tax=Carpediemonas membranifera TaxID=201153 RepID=A0A8J6AQ13_9EUKA|nr:hypothetical protein J8273_7085 [Carpediemonas membranifera]|eukprot:KAG9390826.1 hypothetical protein J8273_7085 [Carpediemonas membranifera]